MMTKRAEVLEEVINLWLESGDLRVAIEKTVESRLFSRQDVTFAIEHLKKTIERGDLRKWVEMNKEIESFKDTRIVLCLHAGNLPLVGFQDMLAVLVSGAIYAGKISKKDPYLLESFLNLLKRTQPVFAKQIRYSTELSNFAGLCADYWMFAGSEDSLSEIKYTLESLRIVKPDSESLLRVAHFSVVVLRSSVKETDIVDLVEAISRYDGKGCRSVALVYSDIDLSNISNELYNIGKHWLSKNGSHFNPEALLKWRYAYNSAVNIDQVWVGNALVQIGHPVVGHNQHVYWQSRKFLYDQLIQFGKGVQQIYVCKNHDLTETELFSNKKDYLRNSQTPELYWKPDGIDPLEWILTR